jgi:hypothetical protein
MGGEDQAIPPLAPWLLSGVEAYDPSTFACIAGVLLGTGMTACLAPALQAARVDPMVTLRYE